MTESPHDQPQPLDYATPARRTAPPWPWVAFIITLLGLTGCHSCIAYVVALWDASYPPAVDWLLFPIERFSEGFISRLERIAHFGPFILNELIFAVCVASFFAAFRHVLMFFRRKIARS